MTQSEVFEFLKNHPNQKFGPTQISRELGISGSTAQSQLSALFKKGSIRKEKGGKYWYQPELPKGLKSVIREWRRQLPYFATHGQVKVNGKYREIKREELVVDPVMLASGIRVANRGLLCYRGEDLPVEKDPSFKGLFNNVYISQGPRLQASWVRIKKISSSKPQEKSIIKSELSKLTGFLDEAVKLLDEERDDEINQIDY